jgi:hypothetical protein
MGAFESQYKGLLSEIQQIYQEAKEFHGKVSKAGFATAENACSIAPEGDHVAYSCGGLTGLGAP